MGDTDLALLVGDLKGEFRAVKEHLSAQDTQRGAMHEENKAELRSLREAMDSTALIARDSKTWIDTRGAAIETRVDNLHDRVTAIEEGKRIGDAEQRGSASVWTWIWGSVIAIASAVGSVLAALTGLSPETIDRIKAFFHGG